MRFGLGLIYPVKNFIWFASESYERCLRGIELSYCHLYCDPELWCEMYMRVASLGLDLIQSDIFFTVPQFLRLTCKSMLCLPPSLSLSLARAHAHALVLS